MTEKEKLAWGADERGRRLDDMAAVRLNNMTLEQAQSEATRRAKKSGMTAGECAHYLRKSRPA